MQRLRPFIAQLRREYNVPYPLAHFKPFVDSRRRFLLEAQGEAKLPGSMRMIYEVETGQLVLDHRVQEFLDRVDFSETGALEAERFYPAGKQSPVVIDPRRSSGVATVHGVRTEVLAELAEAAVSVEEIAADFNLPIGVVRAALAYEWSAA